MFKQLLLITLLSFKALAVESNYESFTNLLIGKNNNYEQYNQVINDYSVNFKKSFIDPINKFTEDHLTISKESLFYPFAGPDISYPLLFFPKLKSYVLVGMEFPGNPEIVKKEFKLLDFQPQIEGYLRSGFFKTMRMSAQIQYQQGVIPMLIAQIGLLNGSVQNITTVNEPYRGIVIDFIHNQVSKKLHYFRANLDDSTDKTKFFEFIKNNNFIDNCMLKASSYKLHQPEFKQMRQFMLENCKLILQDDTGMPVKYLQEQHRDIQIFGNYVRPYGDEFKPYYQKDLAALYLKETTRIPLSFCFGYGCKMTEANILVAKTKDYTDILTNPPLDIIEPEIEAN